MDLSVALKNVKDALDRHPELSVLVGIWAYNAHAIVDVVKQRGIRDKTTVVVFDAAPKAIADMTDGQDRRHGRAEPVRDGLSRHAADEGPGRRTTTQTIHEMLPAYDPADARVHRSRTATS